MLSPSPFVVSRFTHVSLTLKLLIPFTYIEVNRIPESIHSRHSNKTTDKIRNKINPQRKEMSFQIRLSSFFRITLNIQKNKIPHNIATKGSGTKPALKNRFKGFSNCARNLPAFSNKWRVLLKMVENKSLQF